MFIIKAVINIVVEGRTFLRWKEYLLEDIEYTKLIKSEKKIIKESPYISKVFEIIKQEKLVNKKNKLETEAKQKAIDDAKVAKEAKIADKEAEKAEAKKLEDEAKSKIEAETKKEAEEAEAKKLEDEAKNEDIIDEDKADGKAEAKSVTPNKANPFKK